MKNLETLIRRKEAKVAIMGIGYVGLPHVIEIARAGFFVSGIDIKKERVKALNKGKSYIKDIRDKDLKEIIQKRKFKAFNNFSPLKEADVVIICVEDRIKGWKRFLFGFCTGEN